MLITVQPSRYRKHLAETNFKNKNIFNKNDKTIIKDAYLKILTNNADLSLSSSQNNSNSLNNDGWTQ